jgi:streptogramin lyase
MAPGRHAIASMIFLFLCLLPPRSPIRAADAGGAPLWIRSVSSRLLANPFDVAVDRNGVVFLLESGARTVSIFSQHGEFLREIQGKGAWKDPSAIAIGPSGSMFLADGAAGKVLEVDLSGKIRRVYAAGENARLTGVAVYGDAVYCVDNRNHRIVVFRKPGAPPEIWGKRGEGPGQFQSPFRIAIDPSGRLFVTDVMNARVQWFSAFGKHLGTLKRFGAGEGKLFRPTGIALDLRGRLWVGDSYTGLVQLFEERGEFAKAVRLKGRPVVFGDPVGLAVTAGGIWVADQRENSMGLFRE